MIRMITAIAMFLIGCGMLVVSGADGTWESLNGLGWSGIILCNFAIGSYFLIPLVAKLFKK
jgi:hypothetical protein